MPDGSPSPGGEAPTRDRILATAMRLFDERGYEGTTMRAIATEAGVSLGSAYYYFASKEHLVQGFYDRIQDRHQEAAQAVLAGTADPTERLVGVWRAWLDVAAPYHRFATAFFRVAADPASPLSPFSEASAPAREASIAVYRAAAAGSDLRLDGELAQRLPHLLWIVHMGLVLFWVHDDSPSQGRSRALVERTVPVLVRVLRASRLVPVRSVVRDVIRLLDEVGLPGRGG
jgi:AcrR family transcriptional regulator